MIGMIIPYNFFSIYITTESLNSLHDYVVLPGLSIAIILAFVIFFLNDVIAALGQGSQAPELLAAWLPAFVPILLSTSLLLYLEDG